MAVKLTSEYKELLALISKALPSDGTFSEFTEEEEDLKEAIDDQLMKLGSLASTTIDWDLAFSKSKSLLASKKSIQAIYVIWRKSLFEMSAEGLHFLMVSMREVLNNQWEYLYPHGKFSIKLKISRVDEIFKIIDDKLGTTPISEDVKKTCLSELNSFEKIADILSLDVARLSDIKKKLESDESIDLKPVTQSNAVKSAINSQNAVSSEIEHLDALGRGALRREMFSLAHRVNSHDPDAGVGYFMRGYAAWMELSSAPEVNDDGVTNIQPMPPNIVEDVRSQLSRPTFTLLKRLEERLYNNPDWFEGHKMAFQMAQTLEYFSAAEAIRSRVALRIKQIPVYLHAKYANNTPILSKHLQDWLQVDDQKVEAEQKSVDLEIETRDNKEGLSKLSLSFSDESLVFDDIIRIWEDEIKSKKNLRDKALLQLEFAKFLFSKKYYHLLGAVIGDLSDLFESEILQNWEPAMYLEIKSLQRKSVRFNFF